MKNFLDKISNSRIGQRNIKTALSVFICIIFFELIGKESSATFACISAIMSMQDTVENSLDHGTHRLAGTFAGSILGIIFIFLSNYFQMGIILKPLIVSIIIILIIFFYNTFEKQDSIAICSMVFIVIALTYDNKTDAYIYALQRTADTLVGVIVAILVNKYFDIHKIIKK